MHPASGAPASQRKQNWWKNACPISNAEVAGHVEVGHSVQIPSVKCLSFSSMFKDAPLAQHIATEIHGSVSEDETTMTITTIYLNKIKKIDHRFILSAQIRDT